MIGIAMPVAVTDPRHITDSGQAAEAPSGGVLDAHGWRDRVRGELAARLVELREQAGLSIVQTAKLLGRATSWLRALEAGQCGVVKAEALLDLYRVTDPFQRARLVRLFYEGRRRLSGPPPVGPSWLWELQPGAGPILVFARGIPDLLQAEPYARALQATSRKLLVAPWEHGDQLDVLWHRQARLHGPDPVQLHVVLDEAALHTGPTQLRHLVELASRPNISIQVLALRGGPYPAIANPFTVLTSCHGMHGPVARLSGRPGWDVTSRQADELNVLFARLAQLALSPQESLLTMGVLAELEDAP